MTRGARLAADRRGFALVLVLMALGSATLILVSLQSSAYRQAMGGREAVARVRATWAARAGLEATIARMANDLESEPSGSAYTRIDDMAEVASGTLSGASWLIEHAFGTENREGAEDAHAKININRMTVEDLMLLPNMTEDVADAILDWTDPDDDVRELGAEAGFYSQLLSPYEPRNAWMRTLGELELVAGVEPEFVRGEDWNLNGRLDPNEDDGDLSWPPDDADGTLDAGWSEWLTTRSIDNRLNPRGEAMVSLPEASSEQLIAAVEGLTPIQAQAILAHAQAGEAAMTDFIQTPLRQIAQQDGVLGRAAQAVTNLENEQLIDLLDNTTMIIESDGPIPGRVNINTCRRQTLDYLEVFGDLQGSALADLLWTARQSRANGFANIMDLAEIVGAQQTAFLAQYIDVQSNAYRVSCRGMDEATGIEVEIVVTIQADHLPVVISEYVVR